MKKIGITGGIGSGKTTVCRLFALLGVPTHNSDLVAKNLMRTQPELINGIKTAFGSEVYGANEELKTAVLAQKVFGNAAALRRLNALVHPWVATHFEQWCAQQQALGKPFVLKEAAIIYEQNLQKNLDAVLLVYAPETLRIARTMQRSAMSYEQVQARIAAQMPDDDKLKLADFVVFNDETRLVIPQVNQIYAAILA